MQRTALDLAVLSAATFKAARTVSHDKVLSFVREAFVQSEAHEGEEKPVEDGGTRQAIGELLTCSRVSACGPPPASSACTRSHRGAAAS